MEARVLLKNIGRDEIIEQEGEWGFIYLNSPPALLSSLAWFNPPFSLSLFPHLPTSFTGDQYMAAMFSE